MEQCLSVQRHKTRKRGKLSRRESSHMGLGQKGSRKVCRYRPERQRRRWRMLQNILIVSQLRTFIDCTFVKVFIFLIIRFAQLSFYFPKTKCSLFAIQTEKLRTKWKVNCSLCFLSFWLWLMINDKNDEWLMINVLNFWIKFVFNWILSPL